MRKTKIVCTIGPATESEEMLRELCHAGMNVARLNFSHGDHAEHQTRVDRIKKVRDELQIPIAIMLDTKGPEYRIGTFEEGKIFLEAGERFTFTTQEIVGNKEKVSVSYKNLAKEMKKGDTILLVNGLMRFQVLSTTDTDIVCEVIDGGEGLSLDVLGLILLRKVLENNFHG